MRTPFGHAGKLRCGWRAPTVIVSGPPPVAVVDFGVVYGNMSRQPLTLVILAAGRSTRFGRLKQLAPIGLGGEALIDYALYDAARAGFSRFLLVIQETLRPDFDAHLRDAAAQLDIGYAYQRMAHPGLVDEPIRANASLGHRLRRADGGGTGRWALRGL